MAILVKDGNWIKMHHSINRNIRLVVWVGDDIIILVEARGNLVRPSALGGFYERLWLTSSDSYTIFIINSMNI